MPYANEEEAKASNGGAYPPDMSVLVKARKGGADYIYSLLLGYEDPPADVKLDDGVYYNKYMYGNKIKMSAPLMDDIVEYSDGTKVYCEQISHHPPISYFLIVGPNNSYRYSGYYDFEVVGGAVFETGDL